MPEPIFELIQEEDAREDVKQTYRAIKARYGGLLPDIYKAFAHDPEYLASINEHMQRVLRPRKVDAKPRVFKQEILLYPRLSDRLSSEATVRMRTQTDRFEHVAASASGAPIADAGALPLARYFRVLGDPTRLAIIEALLERERTVSELVELLGVSQSRVSNHLACLRWCRFVEAERHGRSVIYRIADERVGEVLRLAASLAEPHCYHLATCTRIGPDWI